MTSQGISAKIMMAYLSIRDQRPERNKMASGWRWVRSPIVPDQCVEIGADWARIGSLSLARDRRHLLA